VRYLSVCSGIEAATVAWHPLGWQPVAFSEIDKFPAAVLAHHYPDTPNLGDMTKFKEWPDAAIDVLVGGTPCQSFSVAGLRKGLADPRGNLMLTYLAIADRYRPRWLVWENVPGVLSSGGGRDFGSFLGALGELGYGWAYRSLDAQFFHLAQRRERVFVVGCLGSRHGAAAVLFERASLSGHPAPRREAGKAAPTTPSRRSGGGGLGTDFDCDGGLIARAIFTGEGTRQDYETTTLVAHSLRADGFDASEDGTGRGTPLVVVANSLAANSGRMQIEATYVPVAIQAGAVRENPESGPDGVGVRTDGCAYTPEARAEVQAGGQVAVAFDARQSDVIQYGEKTGPLDTDGHTMAVAFMDSESHSSGNNFNVAPTMRTGDCAKISVATAMQVRRLTPRECCRLQGFPDDYLDITYRGKPAADGPKYKALGNSMAVPVMAWVGRRIAVVDAITSRHEAAA